MAQEEVDMTPEPDSPSDASGTLAAILTAATTAIVATVTAVTKVKMTEIMQGVAATAVAAVAITVATRLVVAAAMAAEKEVWFVGLAQINEDNVSIGSSSLRGSGAPSLVPR